MEGLPVRQWRKTAATVNTIPPRESLNISNIRNTGWKELPMPRGAELYSPMSQALLRAARMGQVNRPQAPPLEDEKELGENEDAEGDLDTGFITLRWAQVPKHMEVPEPEFLAKRRKGLPSVYGGVVGPQSESSHMRKTKVKKVDEEGNAYVYDVLAPEGQSVEGEIIEDDTQEEIKTEAPAPGTVLEGVGIVNAEGIVVAGDQVMPTPPRRRPPPPKRKAKGPGRGRRKRVSLAQGAVRATGNSGGFPASSDGTVLGPGRLKEERSSVQGPANGDVEMGDDSMLQEGEEGTDDEDEEEGEEGEDGDREEGELSPSPDPDAPDSLSGSPLNQASRSVEPAKHIRELSSSPDLPLAAGQNLQTPSIEIEMAENALFMPPPRLEEIRIENRLTVEQPVLTATTTTGEVTDVILPVDHNPLNGLAEPQGPAEIEKPQETQFSDGDEDLLGSLERHLNNNG
ncbi:hypothetical protein MMC06_003922 [Schaereria dolodes]|nr:hypothetical protein [Schaereria dolodes]